MLWPNNHDIGDNQENLFNWLIENNLTFEEYYELKSYEKINWNRLSSNPNTIDLLKQNKNKINWSWLSINPNAIDLLKRNKKLSR